MELENWTAPDEISVKNTKWRSQSRGRKCRRTEAGDSDSANGDNRGESDDGPVEADGSEGGWNWFTKVTEWRASGECAEGGKVQGMND